MMTGPLNIIIVDDESLITMYVESLLMDLGHTVVASAARVEKALQLAKTGHIDLAILDINMASVLSFPIADVFRARGIPFFFTSGYGTSGPNDAYSDEFILKKPYFLNDLKHTITHILSVSRSSRN